MKRKLVSVLGFVGVLALSIGFMNDFESTEVLVKEQPISEIASLGANIEDGDQYRVVTVEEQEMREKRDVTTVITAEEQEMVENSSTLAGFVPQEKGTGFYFKKEK
ncbi:hypothetical protein [Ammoniphilus sp. 3BR4]|uniref:hypothetical protein n=1 Tax=Ammoniphilus sp. 3BR4 TaxID=3158265 RepID=UPI0034658943